MRSVCKKHSISGEVSTNSSEYEYESDSIHRGPIAELLGLDRKEWKPKKKVHPRKKSSKIDAKTLKIFQSMMRNQTASAKVESQVLDSDGEEMVCPPAPKLVGMPEIVKPVIQQN